MSVTAECEAASAPDATGDCSHPRMGAATKWSLGLLRFLLIFAIGFVVCMARPLAPSQRFSLFGEDGPIFTQQVRSGGIAKSFVTTYGGYYHLLPRAVAAIASVFPLRATPVVLAIGAWAITALAATLAWHSARGLGLNEVMASAVAASVLLLPAAGYEIVDTLTYVEWYCAAATFVFVAAWMNGYRPNAWIVIPLLLISGATTPVLIAGLPFAVVVYWFRQRQRYDLMVTAGLTVAVLIQVVGRLTTTTTGSASLRPRSLGDLYLVRVVDGGLSGVRLLATFYQDLHPIGAATVGVVIVVGLVAAGSLELEGVRRWVFWFLIAESLVLTVMSGVLRGDLVYQASNVGFWARGQNQSDLAVSLTNQGRYFSGPSVCLVTALMVWLAGRNPRRQHHSAWLSGPILTALGVSLLFNVPTSLNRVPLASWQADVSAAKATCVKSHGDAKVSVSNAPGPPWGVTLTCGQAFGRSSDGVS